jgi:hypothetical protein
MTPTVPAMPMPPVQGALASSLCDGLLERLERETRPQTEWPELVLDAFVGEAPLDPLLTASSPPIGKSTSAKSA